MAKFAKFCTWIIRIFQQITGLITLGVSAYMVDQFRKYANFGTPAEVFLPLLFSILALIASGWSLILMCCMGYHILILAAICDCAILAGFIASAVVLRHNFHSENMKNPLRNWLIIVRAKADLPPEDWRVNRSGALVKLLDACVIVMILLFFFTSLLSIHIAYEDYRKDNPVDVERGSRSMGGRAREGYRHRSVSRSSRGGTTTDYTTESTDYTTDSTSEPGHYRDRRGSGRR